MRAFSARILGILFIIAAVFGILFSLLGLIQIWRLKPAVSQGLNSNLDRIDTTLITTTHSLSLLSDTLNATSSNVTALQATSNGIQQSLQDAQPLLETLIRVTGEDLPTTLTNTQQALTSAQASSKLIDNVLGVITSLPIPGMAPYRPQVPLNQALAQVSDSLSPLPHEIQIVNTSLIASRNDLVAIQNQITSMSQNFEKISQNLIDAQKVIQQYQDVIDRLAARVSFIHQHIDGWINSTAWFLSLILIWLGIAQIGLLMQGLELLGMVPLPERK